MDELLGGWATCPRKPDIRLLVCTLCSWTSTVADRARFDASGYILEHYSDGDLVNENTPWDRVPESPNSLYIWGPNLPLGFVTGKIEDAGKPLPMPPQAMSDPIPAT